MTGATAIAMISGGIIIPMIRANASGPKLRTTMTPTTGRVTGKLQYQNIDPRDLRILVMITLTGEDNATRDVRRRRTDFKLGRGYEFNNLPPGTYSLLAETGGTRMWEQRLTIEANQATVVDLTDANTVAPPNFAPSAG